MQTSDRDSIDPLEPELALRDRRMMRVGTVLRYAVAALMLGAAGIHFGLMGEHAGVSWSHGMFFAVTAWLQVTFAAVLIFRPNRSVVMGGIFLNLAILGVWVVSRTVGISIGGGNGTPEAWGTIDGVCAAFEGVAILLLLPLLGTAMDRRKVSLGIGYPAIGFTAILIASLTTLAFSPAVVETTTATGVSADGHNHGAAVLSADGHNHSHAAIAGSQGGLIDAGASGTIVSGALTGKSPCELSGPPVSPGQTGKDAEGHNHRGPLLQLPTTQSETVALTNEQTAARAVALRYPTVAAAEAGGYRKSTVYLPCIGAHYTNQAYAGSFDVNNPSELLYDGTTPDAKIVGLSYLVFHLNGPPEGFTGPNDHWHQHNLNGGLCIGAGGVVIGAETTSPKQCTARGGRKVPLNDIYMLHDWVVPGYECTWGPFASECPELGGRPGGTAFDQPAPQSAAAADKAQQQAAGS